MSVASGGPEQALRAFMATADGSKKSLEPSAVHLYGAGAPRDTTRRTADGSEKSLQASAVDQEAPRPGPRPFRLLDGRSEAHAHDDRASMAVPRPRTAHAHAHGDQPLAGVDSPPPPADVHDQQDASWDGGPAPAAGEWGLGTAIRSPCGAEH